MNTATATAAAPRKTSATLIKTPPATLCFPNLFSPRAVAVGSEPRYSCILLFDAEAQKLPAYKDLRNGVFAVIEAKHGLRAKEMIKSLRLPFRDAGEKDYAGFLPGMVYINPWANTENKPQIIDVNFHDVLVPGDVFAGQLVRAAVRPFYYDNSGNKGVSFGLHSVQIIDPNRPRIDGRPDAKTLFNDGAYAATEEATEDDPF